MRQAHMPGAMSRLGVRNQRQSTLVVVVHNNGPRDVVAEVREEVTEVQRFLGGSAACLVFGLARAKGSCRPQLSV